MNRNIDEQMWYMPRSLQCMGGIFSYKLDIRVGFRKELKRFAECGVPGQVCKPQHLDAGILGLYCPDTVRIG